MSLDNPTLSAIAAFLSGFSKSGSSEHALIRGSFITRTYMAKYRRECKDLDMLYLQPYSLDRIEALIRCSLENVAPENRVLFRTETLSFEEIWKQSLSPGVRAEVEFVYCDTTSTLQIDIAANDPMVEPPSLFNVDIGNAQRIELKTASLETSIAWKFHGLFEHLNGAWMSKTLWDLYVLCRFNRIDKLKLGSAIELAFSSRLDPIDITKRFFFGDFAQSKKSKKSWGRDLIDFGVKDEHTLCDVLGWLRGCLLSVVDVHNDGSLLTHSEVITYRVKELRRLGSEDAIAKLKTLNRKTKILSIKAYNSIPHLPDSRLGKSERKIDQHKVRMLTSEPVNDRDVVIVQEKLDGSCVCAYRRNNQILALGRSGDLASESPNYSRQLWSDWVDDNQERFLKILGEGERACGEWLALAHGTRYELPHEPFVVFDLFDSNNSPVSVMELELRCRSAYFTLPHEVHRGGPCSVAKALKALDLNYHGAIDEPEGLVFRLERNGRLLFRAKYVRRDKVDGCFLPEKTGLTEIWNWHPTKNTKANR